MELINQQGRNSEALQQAIKNFKKSPSDRKTVPYLQQQLAKISDLWNQVNVTDNQIRKNSSIPEDHEYYSSNLYTILGTLYQEVSTRIQGEIETRTKVDNQQEGPSTSNPIFTVHENDPGTRTPSLKLPLKLQRAIQAVNTLLQQASQDTETRSKQFLLMKLRTIEQHWKQVQRLHEQLWTAAGDDYDLEDFIQQEALINDGILNFSTYINMCASTTEEVPNEQNSIQGYKVKLPNIELPKFDGNSLKWRQFRDLFLEIVHNQQLSDCQKLWYLKSSLTGEASRLIQHFPTTSENYTAAWQVIEGRYENKRLLVGAILQRLLTQQPVHRDSSAAVKLLHDTTQECLLGIKALGIKTEEWDPIIVHILSQLLDRQTQMLWEQSIETPRELPKLQDLMKFLELRFQTMEVVSPNKKCSPSPQNSLVTTVEVCVVCKQAHALYHCQKFLRMSSKQRLQLVQSAKCCVNCLKSDHRTVQCTSNRNCQRCQKRHNTLLHLDHQQIPKKEDHLSTSSVPVSANNNSKNRSTETASALLTASQKEKTSVLLSTVMVTVEDVYGCPIECRAILDNGSQVHLITQKLAIKLGMPGIDHQLRIQGVGEAQRCASKRVNLCISSRVTAFTSRIEALVLPTIVSNQPRQFVPLQEWKIPHNIPLADPQFNIPSDVDMLIGSGLFYSILSVGQIKLGRRLPILQNTLLGWVVGGEYQVEGNSDNLTCGMVTEEDIFSAMEKFWEIEECTLSPCPMTAAELKCEKHFASQHRRSADGRFVVKLPFKEDVNGLGQSYGIALQRLIGVEGRLAKNEPLKQEYIKFMREYERLGHMEELTVTKFKEPHYFLPHHAVFKPDSTTTKVRVVFDASAKTSTNVSLNDLLAIGPAIQDDVFTQLLRFRFPRYVFTADIEKMYRQIWVHNDDRKFQLILWRENPEQPVKVFQLNTITYGTSCAPYLAIRCLRQLACDGETKYPLAAHILNKNFYVDDVLAGSDDIKTAVNQLHQLRELLSNTGFNLRKWCSNDQRLLHHIPEEDREVSLELQQSKKDSVKTMGLIWTPREDHFSVKAEPDRITRVTKRIALTDISKIFDPLGFLAPVIITAKIFLQELWKLKLDWDAALPQELHTEWIKFRNEFDQLNQIKISRHVFGHLKPLRMQIHIFADASEKAYGAVAYVRSIGQDKSVIVRLLCAKSKVAPTKQTTLPRLELCAAKLASELMKRIQVDIDIDSTSFHLWSDSTSVLGWIKAQSSNYHTFIANRIASIQRISSSNQWHYVPSKENPADIISRGLNPAQLVNNHFWFYGPRLLHSSTDAWKQGEKQIQDCTLELRQKAKTSLATTIPDNNVMLEIKHNNSFRRLQRIVAYMLRIRQIKTPGYGLLGRANLLIRPQEMEMALQCILRYMQEVEFHQHIQDLIKFKAVQHTSSLAHLSPFLDEKGIVRVGGRLQSADITYDAKHPILLPHKHPFAKLLMSDLHKENMHCGVQTLLAISRQKFWILNGKTLARNIIHNCVQCTRAKPKLAEQIMGNLPRDRVTATRPFYITGIDFFGPVYVHFKGRGKHPVKAYAAVFCCFSTKATHLELVSDLSTEAFIGALKRFIGRRGRCHKIYCDNATNFVGTKNSLKEMSAIIHTEKAQEKILSTCCKNHIEFCFIPPRAPHFGGLWEAAVKSAKYLLRKTLAAASLTYEEMETVLIDAEAILNSRPLTPMSADPNDLTALTPGHFLIGEPLTAVTEPQQSPAKLSCLSRWSLVKQLKTEFWRRWSLEYLNGLQHRYKWNQKCENLKRGTMVIIKDENLPPLKWALGRIDKVIVGNDGQVRVADVRTAANIIRRPIHKLAPLPVAIEETTEFPQAPGKVTNEEARPTASERSATTSTSRKRRNTSSIASLLLTCLVLPLVTTSTINFTPFHGEPGIYFERIGMANIITSRWNLVNFVDLRPLRREAELTTQYLTPLSELCRSIKVQMACNKTMNQITHKIEIIESNNELLKYKRREKRGALNIIGNIASDLFGLLDSEYANQLAETIETLKSNDEILKKHLENQTSFLDQTLTIMKKNQGLVEKELKTIETITNQTMNEMNRFNYQMHQLQLLSAFNMLALQSFMQLTHFQSVQEALIDIMTDAHHGKLNPELLSPSELQTQLQIIQGYNLKHRKLPLPVSDITKYYRLMTISHRITENYVIFNVQIPLTTSTDFELLEMTAIPWIKDNTLFKLHLTEKSLIVDLLRENYMALSSEEIQQCTTINQTLHLCPQIHPLHNQKSPANQCELAILKTAKITQSCHSMAVRTSPYWTPLHEPNTWLYSVGISERVHTVCNNTPSQIDIAGSGIMRIGDGCMLKTPHVSIEGHGAINEVRNIVYAPLCNISQIKISAEYPEHNLSIRNQQVHDDIKHLQAELNKFKTISLNTIRPHDIHHYSVSYSILLMVACCVVCIGVLYWKQKRATRSPQPQPAPRNHIPADLPITDGESEIITMFNC